MQVFLLSPLIPRWSGGCHISSRTLRCAAFQHGVIHPAPGKQIHRWNFSAALSVPGLELPVKGRGLRAAPRGGCRRKGAHLPSPHTWTWHRTNWTWSSSHLLPSFIKKQTNKKKKGNPSLSCCWKSNSPAPLPILQGADGVSGERRVGGRGEGQGGRRRSPRTLPPVPLCPGRCALARCTSARPTPALRSPPAWLPDSRIPQMDFSCLHHKWHMSVKPGGWLRCWQPPRTVTSPSGMNNEFQHFPPDTD